MFDRDNWAEIFSSIKKNKLRTFLTGFSISWGIFMFCILLSAGYGLRNGMNDAFGNRSKNSVQFWGRRTSIPYEGLPAKRLIDVDDRDITYIKGHVSEAVDISPIMTTSVTASYSTYSTSCTFEGINTDYITINGVRIQDNLGRLISDMDIKEKRKVAVINQRLREVLFQEQDPIGKLFIANGLTYTVIGVYKEEQWGNYEQAYIPISTAQILYGHGYKYDDIAFTVKGLETEEANEDFEVRFRDGLASLHHFDKEDKRAIGIWNQLQNYLQWIGIFNGISAFIWIIGAGTLIAGMIGVSNIMLISVRERTREIGIRKALGAKPNSILSSILLESVFITFIFGYIGLFLGVALGELVTTILEQPGMEGAVEIFKNPTIDIGVALIALLILVLSGLVAGYFPALKAVRVAPVEAMRAE